MRKFEEFKNDKSELILDNINKIITKHLPNISKNYHKDLYASNFWEIISYVYLDTIAYKNALINAFDGNDEPDGLIFKTGEFIDLNKTIRYWGSELLDLILNETSDLSVYELDDLDNILINKALELDSCRSISYDDYDALYKDVDNFKENWSYNEHGVDLYDLCDGYISVKELYNDVVSWLEDNVDVNNWKKYDEVVDELESELFDYIIQNKLNS